MNSSPPHRPARSESRTVAFSTEANSRRTSSPTVCPWTSFTALKSSRSARTSVIGAPRRSAREISAVSASSHWRRLAMPVSPSTSACRSTMRCSRAFSSAIAAWDASELGRHPLLVVEDVADEGELAERRAPGGQRELELLAVRVGVAGLDDAPVVRDESRAGRAGRLDRGLDDHPEQRADVVGGGERLAEARDRAAEPSALVLELGEPRLELVRHVVEGRAEQRELVAALHRHALAEAAARDPVRGLGERAQRPDDRPALEVRDERDDAERERAARAAAGCASSSSPRRSPTAGVMTAKRTLGRSETAGATSVRKRSPPTVTVLRLAGADVHLPFDRGRRRDDAARRAGSRARRRPEARARAQDLDERPVERDGDRDRADGPCARDDRRPRASPRTSAAVPTLKPPVAVTETLLEVWSRW